MLIYKTDFLFFTSLLIFNERMREGGGGGRSKLHAYIGKVSMERFSQNLK